MSYIWIVLTSSNKQTVPITYACVCLAQNLHATRDKGRKRHPPQHNQRRQGARQRSPPNLPRLP